MKIYSHAMSGCTPTPLASYLKALGIFRIVADQCDPACRGWWQDEQFHLMSSKSQDEIERFFLAEYQPTPLVSPWNKGCGFFKANDPGLIPLERSTAGRFEKFRMGVTASRELLDEISEADAMIRSIKAATKRDRTFQSDEQRRQIATSLVTRETLEKIQTELAKDIDDAAKKKLQSELEVISLLSTNTSKPGSAKEADALKAHPGYKRLLAGAERRFKTLKEALLNNCRQLWRGPHAQWLSTAVVLGEDGSPDWPSLLGTGGNDGNLDFTNTFMCQLGELFDAQTDEGLPKTHSHPLLRSCLWSQPTNALQSTPIGQFMPGSAGGFNSSTGIAGSPLVNPWDFVLMLEGTFLFSARATRRLAPNDTARASAPFAVRAQATGYASPGSEKSQRGEQWMPIWSRPANFSDVTAMFSEARLQLKRQLAHRPIDAARAIGRLGTVRGISSFVRYGYLERNGQSTLAVPLGRITVRAHPSAYLIDDLAAWLDRLQMRARDSYASSSFRTAERTLSDSIFNALTHDDSRNGNPSFWQAILGSCVAIEDLQRRGNAIEAGPIPPLNPGWIATLGDSVEVRLALSLASAAAGYSRNGWPVDSIRGHWLPLKSGAFAKYNTSEKRLINDPRVVMTGRDFVHDCAAVIQRRLIEAERDSKRILPLVAFQDSGACLEDIEQFIAGATDDQKLYSLARALMAIKYHELRREHLPASLLPGNIDRTSSNDRISPTPELAWLMLRLNHLPRPLREGLSIPVEPSVVRLLQANSANRAIEIAARRLQSVGLRPPLRRGYADAHKSSRWAAALVFPLSQRSIRRAAEIVCPTSKGTVRA